MKPLKFIFSSLFSNEMIIKESKHQKWWLAIVIMLFSCIISLVPSFVSMMTVQGSNIITANQNYGIDYGLKQFSLSYLGSNDNQLKIIDEKLTLSENATKTDNGLYYTLTEIEYNEKIALTVYYVDYNSEETNYKTFDEKMAAAINAIKASRPTENQNESKLQNSLILGKELVYLLLCGSNETCNYTTEADGSITITATSQNVSTLSGNYKNIAGDLANLNGYAYGNSESDKANNAFNNWKNFFDKAYESPRNIAALRYAGINLGMDLIIVMALALTTFLLSKTKASVVKYKFLESLKMVFFAILSPAIISIIIMLLIPSFQSMAFLMCCILRITWLGMKATNPPSSQPIRK